MTGNTCGWMVEQNDGYKLFFWESWAIFQILEYLWCVFIKVGNLWDIIRLDFMRHEFIRVGNLDVKGFL